MKICSKCGEVKAESEFYIRTNGKLRTECKVCHIKQKKEYAHKNKDIIIEYRKEYVDSNKDKIKDYMKKYSKEYYQENKDNIQVKHKEWRIKNKELLKEKSKEYRENNKSKRKEHERQRYNTDDIFRFKQCLRKRLQQAFKLMSKNGKTKSCSDYGIDFEAIYNHVGPRPEGDWHLDHIIPLCKFNLDIPEHVRLAHLPQNLQWLPADENLSKNDSVDMEIIRCSLALTIIAQEIGLI